MDLKLLEKLFKTPATNSVFSISSFIKTELEKMGVPYHEDVIGNIFNINLIKKPLLCAHMDTVQGDKDIRKINTIKIKNGILRGNDMILGGDDKCGIYIILDLLRENDFNFLFTVDEEIGAMGAESFVENNSIEHISYGLVLDRKGNSDIICTMNEYGVEEFEDLVSIVGLDFGYKPNYGLFSDADELNKVISCANLSVGYHKAHSRKEYVVIHELENAKNFTEKIIIELEGIVFDKPEIKIREFEFSSGKPFDDVVFGECLACGNYEGDFYVESLGKFLCIQCIKNLRLELEGIEHQEEVNCFMKEMEAYS